SRPLPARPPGPAARAAAPAAARTLRPPGANHERRSCPRLPLGEDAATVDHAWAAHGWDRDPAGRAGRGSGGAARSLRRAHRAWRRPLPADPGDPARSLAESPGARPVRGLGGAGGAALAEPGLCLPARWVRPVWMGATDPAARRRRLRAR